MGVQGLWDLLSPVGRPVSLESLENKILAVDVSIWLNQAIKGIRDKKGESVPNAHLLSIFHKICKLLFYRIKPVFVFDGSTPLLKKQTLHARQTQRNVAANNAKKASHSILKNYIIRRMKQDAGVEMQDQLCHQVEKANASDIYSASNDMYYIASDIGHSIEPESDSDEEIDMYNDYMLKNFQNPSLIDFETDEFKSLPLEVQHELLNTISEAHKRRYWALQEMPEEYQTFSNYQMNRLLQRRKLHKRLEEVEKDINSKNTASLETIYKSYVNMDVNNSSVEASRVMSEDSSHLILVKQQNKSSGKTQPEEQTEAALACQDKVAGLKTAETPKHFSFPLCNTEIIIQDKGVSEDGINSFSHETCTAREIVLNNKSNSEVSTVSDICTQEVTMNSTDHIIVNTSSQKSHSSCETERINSSHSLVLSNISPGAAEISKPESDSYHKNTIALNKTNDTTVDFAGCKNDESGKREFEACKQDTITCEEKMHVHNTEHITEKKNEVPSSVTISITLQKPDGDDDDEDGLVPVEELEITEDIINVEDLKRTEESMSTEELERTERDDEKCKETSHCYLLAEQDSISLIEELETLNREKQKQERRAQSIAEHMYEETKELLKLFGVPFIDSPTEAEAQCAKLDMLSLTNGTITDDSDIWLFGGHYVYKNFFSKNKYVEFFKYTDIESHFNLDRPKLIALAMLTGSDYTQGIQGIGPVTAMEILSEFPGHGIEHLQNFKKWWSDFREHKERPKNATCEKLSKFNLDDSFPSEVVYDAYLHPTVDESTEHFSWGHPDLDQLREFAQVKFGWDKNKIDDMLLPVLKKLNENQLQTRIDSFFTVTLRKEVNPLSSKRIKKAITKMHLQGSPSNSRSVNKVQKKSRKHRKQNNKSMVSASPKKPNEITLSEDSSSDS